MSCASLDLEDRAELAREWKDWRRGKMQQQFQRQKGQKHNSSLTLRMLSKILILATAFPS